MSEEDRERWNRRYAERTMDWDPSSWLLAVGEDVRSRESGALALDVACGNGRNAIHLARLGYAVDAWDVSDVGLGLLRERLAELAAPAAGAHPAEPTVGMHATESAGSKHPDEHRPASELPKPAPSDSRLDVRPRQIDLDAAALPPGHYDLIANIFFLDRRLFPAYVAALRPGGRLVFETFVALGDGRRAHVRPEHMLRPGELRAAFVALDILRYDEDAERGTARLLGRKP